MVMPGDNLTITVDLHPTNCIKCWFTFCDP